MILDEFRAWKLKWGWWLVVFDECREDQHVTESVWIWFSVEYKCVSLSSQGILLSGTWGLVKRDWFRFTDVGLECKLICFGSMFGALLQRRCGVSGGLWEQHGNCAGCKRRTDESVMAVLDGCNYVIMYDLDRSFSVGWSVMTSISVSLDGSSSEQTEPEAIHRRASGFIYVAHPEEIWSIWSSSLEVMHHSATSLTRLSHWAPTVITKQSFLTSWISSESAKRVPLASLSHTVAKGKTRFSK